MMKSFTKEFFDSTLPICKICNKQVDKLEYFQDFATNEIIIIAFCHNQQDTCIIKKEFFLDYSINDIKRGLAFDKSYLEFALKLEHENYPLSGGVDEFLGRKLLECEKAIMQDINTDIITYE